MTFAEQFADYFRWKNTQRDTPEAYEEWLEMKSKADKWDAVVDMWTNEINEDDGVSAVVNYLNMLDDSL